MCLHVHAIISVMGGCVFISFLAEAVLGYSAMGDLLAAQMEFRFFRAFDCLRYSLVGSFLLRSKPRRCFLHLFSRCDSPSGPPPPCAPGVHCPSGSVCLSPQCTPLSLHLPSTITLRAATCLQRSACKSHRPTVPPTTMLLLNLPSDLLVPLHLLVLLFTSSPTTLPSSSSFLRSVGNSRSDFHCAANFTSAPCKLDCNCSVWLAMNL